MLTYRKFEKESDYDIMRCILRHNCLETGCLHPQLHIGELDFDRYAFDESPDYLCKTTWIITDNENETEVGFFTVVEDEIDINITMEYESFINDTMNFIEKNCYSEGATILAEANSENVLLNNILEQRGYTKTEHYRFNGMCDLSKIALQEQLPIGYSIRTSLKQDVEKRAELFGIPTGGVGTTPEKYERMMNAPSYGDALDLVVELNHSEIIAYCTIWNDPVSKVARIEPVACVEEHRRKGIMKNTLLLGMNIMKERGVKYMYVSTGGKNIASQALYKSVGFVEHGKNYEWEKVI